MDLFDELIGKTLKILDNYQVNKIEEANLWPIENKNIFLLDKESQTELGGYPNDSINLLALSSTLFKSGVYVIGNPSSSFSSGHVSFGKIVLLNVDDDTNDNIYDFSQKILLADSKCYFKDVMTRASSKHYFINYKVSKKAIKDGFNLNVLGNTIRNEFLKVDGIKDVAIILIYDESPLYKELLPIAEKIKEITITLNHIFDGINMDCGHCNMSTICDEVKGLREIHKKKIK